MPYDGLEALQVENFGGLNTLQNATDVPQFVSPDCQNVEFIPGRVQQRPGTSLVVNSPFSANVTYVKSFQLPSGNVRNLFIDALGNFGYEDVTNNPTVYNLVSQNFLPNLYPNSVTLFGKEWLALGDGKQGQDIPRQYDGTNVFRVSQGGPGAPPAVADFLPAPAAIGTTAGAPVTIVASPNGILWGGAVDLNPNPEFPTHSIPGWTTFTVVTTTAHNLTVGASVTITGATPSVVNGTWTVGHVTNSTTFFIFYTTKQSLVSNGGGGTLAGTSTTLTMSRQGNVTTVFTTAVHSFQVGWQVQIAGISNVAVGGAATGTQLNGVVTISTATPHGMVPGATAIVAGMTDATYNGTFIVVAVPSTTTFTYIQVTTNASSTGATVSSPFNGFFQILGIPTTTSFTYKDLGPNITSNSTGTATIIGSVVGGTHQITVQFLLVSGYLTQPAPPLTFVASGSKMLSVNTIPTGPSNVIARYISITPISSGQFFYIPTNSGTAFTTIINDNTTTAVILNFGDQDLLNGVNINDDFNLIELGEVIGFTEYNSRLVPWGMTNKVQNFNNLGFDGGFSQDGNMCPLGWIPDPVNYVGGGKAPISVTGDAYAITGDGIHATQGLISQSAAVDFFGDPILSPGTAYTLTFRAQKNNILIGANLVIQLFSALGGFTTTATVNIGTQVSTATFTKFSFSLATIPSPVPNDLLLQVFATNVPNGQSVYVDCLEHFPTANPIESSVIRFSGAEDPESFNGITGFIQPSEENGQAVRNAFIIRDFLYIVKERSLFVTRDDGQNEPDAWEVDEVSSKVGTPSPRGVGVGDEWAVIAAESGLWYFTGGQLSDDNKLSQEIQPTWDSINWKFGHLIDVKVDTIRKRVYINVPLGTATVNNTLLTIDYTEGWNNAQFSQNSNTGMGGGVGRKWCPWTIQASSINLCLQQDNSFDLYVGNSFGNGKIYFLDSTAQSDYGNPSVPASFTAIDAYWQSGYFQNGTSRLDFQCLIANAVGTGLLNLLLRIGDQPSFYPIRGWNLSPVGLKNMERQIQKQHFRAAIRFEMNTVGNTFMIQGFALLAREATWAKVRGVNF